MCRSRRYNEKSLYSPLHFPVNLKLLLKKSHIKMRPSVVGFQGPTLKWKLIGVEQKNRRGSYKASVEICSQRGMAVR